MALKKKKSVFKKPLKPQKSLVILGANGVIGSRVLKYFEENKTFSTVVVVDQQKPKIPLKKARFYKFDLTAPTADADLAEILLTENCDTLVHTALPASPIKNMDYAHEFVAIGSYHIFNACHAAKVKKVVMSTTTDVYGAFPTNPNYLTETMPLKGSLQDKTLGDRIDAEKQAQIFQKKNPDSVVSIFRHCTLLGPDIDTYKTRFLKRKLILTMLGYDPLFQFLHIDDALNAFIKLIVEDHPGVFNFAGDGVLPLSRIIELCGAIRLPVTPQIFKSLMQFLWNVDLSPAPASLANFLKYICVAGNQKFKQKVGFKPRYTTKEALLAFIQSDLSASDNP